VNRLLLSLAARFDRAVRKAYTKSLVDDGLQSYYDYRNEVMSMVRTVGNQFDQIIEICYPKQSRHPEIFASPEWIRDNICKELGIPLEVWNERTGGLPMVALLASESSEMAGEGWSIKQAIMAMHALKEGSVLETAKKLHRDEAPLFWARVLGERPPMPLDKLLAAVAKGRQSAISVTKARNMLAVESPFVILARLLNDDALPYEPLGIQPGQPFKGPVYHIWSKATLPEKMYIDPIDGPRRYLHITQPIGKGHPKGILYNREGSMTGTLHYTSLPTQEGEHVFEVETDGIVVNCITDYLSTTDDWYLFERPYVDRLKEVPQVKCHVRTPTIAEGGSSVEKVLNRVDGSVRLVSAGPFAPGEDGGWVLNTSTYEYPLLLTRVKKDEQYEFHAILSALDGFDIRDVGQVKVPVNVLEHLRLRLAKAGYLIGHEWMPVDEEGIIFNVEVKAIESDLTISNCEIVNLDDNLGFSDTSQITDLAEMLT